MKKKRVLILFHPFTLDKTEKPNPDFVMGIGYILAVLRKAGHEVRFLDAFAEGLEYRKEMSDNRVRYGLPFDKINEIIDDFNPDLVGISCQYTLNAQDGYDLAKAIKSHNPNRKIVFGGSHSTVNWKLMLDEGYADFVVVGEGEKTIVELVGNLEDSKKYPSIKGLAYKLNGKIMINERRSFIVDLDELPSPARDLMPMHLYNEAKDKVVHYNKYYPLDIITSRGCPFNCVFCAVKVVMGNKWRSRSPENVVEEIEELVKTYNIKEIRFMDDSISIDKQRLIEICNEIIHRKLKILWSTPNGIAIWTLDYETLKLMKKSGCYRLTFGLESGNKDTLNNFIHKRYDYDRAISLIKYANKLGMWTVGTFIIGFPYEKIDSINDTINFAISSNVDFPVFYIATPLPGTEMYDIYLKEGLISPNAPLGVLGINTNTAHFTAAELRKIRDDAYKRFIPYGILRSWKIIYKVRSIDDIPYLLKLLSNFIRHTFNLFFRTTQVRDLR